jgi:hypothetical protein
MLQGESHELMFKKKLQCILSFVLIWLKPSEIGGLVVVSEHVERTDGMENGPKVAAE